MRPTLPLRWTTSTPLSALPLLALLLAGCGSDGGGNSSNLEDAASLQDAPFVVVETASGRVYGRKTLSGLGSEETYRTGSMVFRRISASPTTLGHPGDDFFQDGDGEDALPTSVGTYYLAVFECSQAQWQQLTGSRPWSGLPTELSRVGGSAAAHNLALDPVLAALDTATGKLASGRLRLPSDAEWEHAARLGTTTRSYTFHDHTASAPPGIKAITDHAWTFETAGGQIGPFPVGSLQASPGGFWDLHGNVWELTASGVVRGGSWRDVVLQARIANRNAKLDRDIPHPLVGVRLALDLK